MIKLKMVQFMQPVRVGRGTKAFIDIEKKHKHCKLLALLPDKECVVVVIEGDCKLIPIHVNIRSMTPLEMPSMDEYGVRDDPPAVQADAAPKKKPGRPKGKRK